MSVSTLMLGGRRNHSTWFMISAAVSVLPLIQNEKGTDQEAHTDLKKKINKVANKNKTNLKLFQKDDYCQFNYGGALQSCKCMNCRKVNSKVQQCSRVYRCKG